MTGMSRVAELVEIMREQLIKDLILETEMRFYKERAERHQKELLGRGYGQ